MVRNANGFLREGKEHSCPKFENYYKRNIRSDRSWLKYEPGGRKHGAKPGLCVLTEALSRHSQESFALIRSKIDDNETRTKKPFCSCSIPNS